MRAQSPPGDAQEPPRAPDRHTRPRRNTHTRSIRSGPPHLPAAHLSASHFPGTKKHRLRDAAHRGSRERDRHLSRPLAPSFDRFGPLGRPMSDFTPSNNPLPLSHHHSTPLRHPPTTSPPARSHCTHRRDWTPACGPSRCYSAHTTPPRPARHRQGVGGAARPVEVGTTPPQPYLNLASWHTRC